MTTARHDVTPGTAPSPAATRHRQRTAGAEPPASQPTAAALPPQHSLPFSVLMHLLPGAALTVFIVLAAPVMRSLGLPTAFALFVGIGLVVVPIELGYLAVHAKRTSGSWNPLRAVDYTERIPTRRLVLLGAGLAAWFMLLLVVSTVLLDDWLASTFFAWMPEAILQFSTFEDDAVVSGAVAAVLALVALALNGLLGPVTEELYFRGHLLPRIARYGRWAPVLNTALFSLYHFWTPWQNATRIIGFLPIAWTTWRKRSVSVAIVAHVTINLTFLLLMGLMILGSGA